MSDADALREAFAALDEAKDALGAASQVLRERLEVAMKVWAAIADAEIERVRVSGETPAG